MPPWLVNLLLVVAAGGGGFLLKRRIERRPEHERLERQEKVLAIRRAMRDQDVSVADLNQFERVLLGKDPETVEPDDEAVTAIADAAIAHGDRGLTQAELNELAHARWLRADSELRETVRKWRAELPPSRQPLLDEAQRAWESFRDAQASFAASSFEGGTIVPTIFSLARETLTRQRQLELASQERMELVQA